MSRVFEALRRSEEEAGKHSFDSAQTFISRIEDIGRIEEKPELLPAVKQQIHLRPENRIVVYSDPNSPGGERFRLLQAYLRDLRNGGKLKVLLVTSALPGDGKSTIAANLATALAEQGKHKVLLLEGDLRRPSFATQWGLKPWEGLAEILQHDGDPWNSIRRVEPLEIYLLPAGVRLAEQTELLPPEKYAELIARLASRFEWIIVDSPPAIPIADTLALKQTADAVLVVARAGHTPREALEETIKQFDPGQVVGVILNSAEELDRGYGGYYYQPAAPEGSA